MTPTGRSANLEGQDDIRLCLPDPSNSATPTQDVAATLVSPEDIAALNEAYGSEAEASASDASDHFLLQKVADDNLSQFWEGLLWSSSHESLPDEDTGALVLKSDLPSRVSSKDSPETVVHKAKNLLLHHGKSSGGARFRFQATQRREERQKQKSREVDRASNEAMQREGTVADAFHASLDKLSQIIDEMAKLARISAPSCSDREHGSQKAPRETVNAARPQNVEDGQQMAPFDVAVMSKGRKNGRASRSGTQEDVQPFFPALVPEQPGCARERRSSATELPSRPEARSQEGRVEQRCWPPTGLEEIGSSRQHSSRDRKLSAASNGGRRLPSSAKLKSSFLRLDGHKCNRHRRPADETCKAGADDVFPKKTVSDRACDGESLRDKRSGIWESAPEQFVRDEEWPADLDHCFAYGGRASEDSLPGHSSGGGLRFDREVRDAMSSQHIWRFADSDSVAPRDTSAQRRAEVFKTSIGGNPYEPFPLKAASVRLVGDVPRAGQRLCNIKVVCIISPAPEDSPVTLPSHLRRAKAVGSTPHSPPDP